MARQDFLSKVWPAKRKLTCAFALQCAHPTCSGYSVGLHGSLSVKKGVIDVQCIVWSVLWSAKHRRTCTVGQRVLRDIQRPGHRGMDSSRRCGVPVHHFAGAEGREGSYGMFRTHIPHSEEYVAMWQEH